MTGAGHQARQLVRSTFDGRTGVIIESDADSSLIEFTDWDEDEREHFTHRKWLPSQQWVAA